MHVKKFGEGVQIRDDPRDGAKMRGLILLGYSSREVYGPTDSKGPWHYTVPNNWVFLPSCI